MPPAAHPEPPAFEPRRFETSASHYLTGRPPYSQRCIARVAQISGLDSHSRVLDLGCGPGPLAHACADYAGEVIGVDPEPEMLRIARENAPANTWWSQGSSNDIGSQLGQFRLVTMGRSFHWMDRVDTLRRLDGMIEPDGMIALFHDRHLEVPENRWHKAYKDLLDGYTPESARQTHRRPGWVPHASVLLGSAFSELEEVAAIDLRQTGVETLVERAFSMSSTSPARLAGRGDALAQDIRRTMAAFAPQGTVTEVVATVALMARRPVANA